MQRTLNFTNRKRITRDQAKFEIDSSKSPPVFSVKLSIPVNDYPADASVFIDAYCKETRQRFECGTVSRIEDLNDLVLGEIDLSAPTQFRIITVDESGKHGRILASGEGFRSSGDEEEDRNSSLLTLSSRALDEVVWKIELETGGKPQLCINNRIPDAIRKIQSNHSFRAIILPSALRELLLQYMLHKERFEEDMYYGHWMDFAESLAGTRPETNDALGLMEWIDKAVKVFSKKFGMCELLCESLEKPNS